MAGELGLENGKSRIQSSGLVFLADSFGTGHQSIGETSSVPLALSTTRFKIIGAVLHSVSTKHAVFVEADQAVSERLGLDRDDGRRWMQVRNMAIPRRDHQRGAVLAVIQAHRLSLDVIATGTAAQSEPWKDFGPAVRWLGTTGCCTV